MSMNNKVAKRSELIQEAKKLQKEVLIKEELPHLFRIKPYRWMLQYWGSTNTMKFICAGNQVGKSTAQQIHCIDLATDKKKWKKYFQKREPQMFWYIYPSKAKIQEEFAEKWLKENLPKGSMVDHPIYGWKKFNIDGEFAGIKFNSGVSIYFKSWGQDHQAGTCDAIFADEELPADLYPELSARLTATSGIFSMVFTATLNQAYWYDVMERRGKKGERFPEAAKWQVSMEYDCKYFADGTPSHFTEAEINKRKNNIGDQTEVDRRIHGRFVTSEGLKFKSFHKLKNVKTPMRIPYGWEYYGGVDIGTGGDGHPAAISIIAVRPDFKYGRVVRFWRGNDEENTDTTQILNKFISLSAGLPMTKSFYDWSSKEFELRASAAGIPFSKAEKSHSIGDDLLNVLFKNLMLDIEEGEFTDHLIHEFETLKKETNKKYANDDGIDSLRYGISSLPWDFSDITSELIDPESPKAEAKTEDQLRMEQGLKTLRASSEEGDDWNMDKEFEYYNELLDAADDYYGDI